MDMSTGGYQFPDLGPLVNPASVVLVGASERRESIGGRAFVNLVEESDFRGELYLVNPARARIGGYSCWPSVAALPAVPDLAVVAVPAPAVLPVLRECAAKGIRFVILFTSGFGETGDAGREAEAEMKAIAQASGMRIYGPNSPGLSNMNARLGFTFSPAFKLDLRSGPVGLATQGGGLGRSFLQSMERGTGTGLWCSAGNEVDLEVSDFIHYMAEAPDIRVIVLMMEGVKDGRKFVAAARHAARCGKPIVALKIGKSEYGIKAAQSHTASIAGSAEVNSAVFRQLGIIEVDDVDELVDVAWLLVRRAPSDSERLAVFSFSGGAAALAADMIGLAGLELAVFHARTRERLAACLPGFAPIDNPVDTTAAVLADMSIADASLQAIVEDPDVGLLLFPVPMDYGEATTLLAESAVRAQARGRALILPVWVSDRLGGGFHRFVEAGMVPARSMSKAVAAMRAWAGYGAWRAGCDPRWEPLLMREEAAAQAGQLVVLDEPRSKAWLARNGIAVPSGACARTPAEALKAAETLGYPVVAKIVSAQIAHKSDIGAVRVGLADGAAVLRAWDDIHAAVSAARPDAVIEGLLIEKMAPAGGVEILVGVHRDPVFGHMLTFGLGGIHVEIFKDVTRRLLPLTRPEAAAMIREVRCYPLLDGARGRPACDLEALEDLLMAVSDFVAKHARHIEEMDLNPVWVGPRGQGATALDAVIVHRAGEAGTDSPDIQDPAAINKSAI